MEKKSFHNPRIKRIKSIFKASERELPAFLISVLKAPVVILVLALVSISSTQLVESKRSTSISFGAEQVVNIFPSEVETIDWAGVESVLVQDLSDDALYQDFSAKNSAYVPQPMVVPNIVTPATPASAQLPSSINSESSLDSVVHETELTSEHDLSEISDVQVESEVPPAVVPISDDASEPESVSEPVVTSESVSEEMGVPEVVEDVASEVLPVEVSEPVSILDSVKSVFSQATEFFPLAQLSITSTTASVSDEVVVVVGEVLLVEESVTEEALLLEDVVYPVNDVLVTEVEDITYSEPEVVPDTEETALETTEPLLLIDEVLNTPDSTSSLSVDESVEEVVVTEGVDGPVSEVSVQESSTQVHEITLANFNTAPLEPGQIVNGVQLRMSFAAQLDEPASGTVPYVEVLYGDTNEMMSAGAILVDDESSNATNGGYYLFALPTISNISELEGKQVTLRYHGDRELLDGMFLDAVWLELDTRIVTDKDLKERGVANKLNHLKAPVVTALVSDRVNFLRTEQPLFNLRYTSQRNSLIRGIRGLVGKKLVEVEKVEVNHASFGLLGIKTDVVVTKEGLVTIEIPDTEVGKMRPGTYEIEILFNEGGEEFVDTFSFQWGMLAINPNKSEYQVGETAEISIGALSPNGNTVCEANLDLYITDPIGSVSKLVVDESGLCDGNNVIDVPDFYAVASTTVPGTHQLYLERLDNNGEVMSFTNDTFLVSPQQKLSIERDGPTRVYPPSPYPMTLTVATNASFDGVLTERVPKDFIVTDTTADITIDGDWQVLTWDVSVRGAGTEVVSYSFDAPDISPYLFNLGPASLQGEAKTKTITVASTTSSTTEQKTAVEGGALFSEHRQWQIASDAVGNMILYFDGASIPAGWTCLSCGSGTFFQNFVMGSSTYNTTGGTPDHGHTVNTSLLASAAATVESGAGGPAIVTHSHTLTPTVATSTNLPEYSQLQVIQFNSAGEPGTIPAGAIAIFDVASSSLPTNWNRYAAQDGRYVRGENTIGTTGGSNTHAHTVSGTTGGSTGGDARTRGGGAQASAATNGHTHTISTSTETLNNEPPYIEVVLAQASIDVTPTNGIISMWSADVAGGWIDMSGSGDPFSDRFLKASTTYGGTGGGVSHSHVDINGAVTSVPSATIGGRTGASGASDTHTHNVNFTSFSTSDNLPPYLTAVFGKRQGTNPVYDQVSSLWYVNEAAQTPTDIWPTGGSDLTEKEPITATSTPVLSGDKVRLRINAGVTNATSSAGATFKLQFSAANICSAASAWSDVGDTSSTTVWRGYNNGGVSDHGTLDTLLLASSTATSTYEENGYSTTTPFDIPVGDYGEWDFVLQQNGALAGTNYCFRMVENDGTAFISYSHYPQLFTNEAPLAVTLEKLFDNEKAPSSTPWFYFVTTDTEGEKIHYEIEVDDNYTFASPEISRNTINNSSLFENQVLISDKAPFRQGEQIKFVDSASLATSTYYWRVRAQDPDGSSQWGDWSVIRSFTIDTTLSASAWHQTEDEQFDINTLTGTETGTNEVALISGSTTGTMISVAIDFTDGEEGTAWDSLAINETDSSDVLNYQIEYFDATDTWTLIPDGDLPGNSTGLASSTNLLGLDTGIYTVIRVIADFTANTGTPSLQDWTVNWGYRVETPIVTKLFPNEQVGTTTPTFEFSATDPQADSLTYQIRWSLTPDFAASTTRTSDADTGFVNIDAGGDTDPFVSGDSIQFTIQPADVLTGTTTYWWQVRAKDTTGDNAYSFWTEEQSFTVIPGTDISTWFQTTQEQFNSNILSGTYALATDDVTVATTATEAILVYGEGTVSAPRYRQWDGAALSSEGVMQDIGSPLKWVAVKAGTTREEYVAATIGTDADVNVQVFSTGIWSDLTELTTSVANINARGLDVAYETTSGDAMVAYCDGDADPSYYIWDGSTWTSGGIINLASASNCEWIQLESDPTSDEIIILSRDATGNQYEAQVWNGTTWGNSTTQGGITEAAHEGMALMYEESGGQALIVTSDGNPARFRWNSWNGTTWGTAATQGVGDDFEWGQMARDVGSDEIILCYQDEDSDVGVVRWTGSAWAGQVELDIDGNAKTDPGFACVFEDTVSRDNYILTSISNTTQTNYYDWNNTAWSTATQVNTIGDAVTAQLERTGDANILGIFFDDPADSLLFSTWNGTGWSTTDTFETDASVGTTPFGYPYSMTPRNSGKDGTTIVSPGVNFSDGTGPYWKTFSWNDSQSGTSEILYHIQYYTASGTWAFIPDVDLPFNVAGTSTGPVDLSSLDKNLYSTLRPYAELTCDGLGNCPVLNDWKIEWAGGITISGSAQQYDQSSNVTSGTVAVAVNGVLQSGKTGTISAGAWSIGNVTVFEGDIVTVFVTSAADINEAVGVARYDGSGDMDGITLYERHMSLGSSDATTTPFTNADIGQYDFTNTEDVFFDLNGTTLEMCADSGCSDVEFYIQSSSYYTPTGYLITHDIENNGTLTTGAYTIEVNGSWDNNATTSMTGSTVVFAATSTSESIDSTGAVLAAFDDVTFGTTTGNGTWSLSSILDVDGDLIVSRGTLARATTSITLAGNLSTEANGFWAGIATTTFDGNTAATWSDANASLQNVGYVVVDGVSKSISLAGNVAAQDINIAANDTLDASVTNYDITVYGNWNNQNNFLSRSGEVLFAATSTGRVITTAADSFYDLSFIGIGGAWSFTEDAVFIDNDFTVATGTVTLPTATTTIAGSFDSTAGSFVHNNGTILFTSAAAETITFDGGLFTNVAYNLNFNGGGSWIINDTNATSTNDVIVEQGTVNFPSGVLAIGGTLTDSGGTFVGGTGTTLFYSSASELITAGGSSFSNLDFNGTGDWSFSDTDVTATGDLVVTQGTITLPAGTFSIGGSYDNADTVTAGTSLVTFDSLDTGETINFGSSSLYDVTFNSITGGWTIAASATTTNDFTLTTSSLFTLDSGQVLSVGGVFTNSVGGASTTWTGSTVALESGEYSINTKTDNGDLYNILDIAPSANVSMWNSISATYAVDTTGSLYSQDHNAVDGDLYIFGQYVNDNSSEYWSYATDFDGTDLATTSSERQVDVRFADSASASFGSSSVEILGGSIASTTIANQGAGTYIVDISAGTTTAQYYDFADLGVTGLSLLSSTTVTSLRDGGYTVAAPGGSAITLSSTTIDTNPGKQIYNVTFATTTAIAVNNVSQTDGTPVSFWWFREGSGNLYGETKDNDTGDPGSVRFDDSSLVITISGTVYSDAGTTPIIGGTCDGAAQSVRIVVDGGTAHTGSCSNIDGTYSIGGVTVIGDPTLTIYLDNASGGEYGSVITRTPTADITNLDIYGNRVIVRNEDTEALSIANLAVYDNSDDTDLRFVAATTSDPDTLNVLAGNELFVFATSTFSPGGEVTLNANAAANSYDGTLYIDDNATFTGVGTTTYTVGGRFVLGTGSTFVAASSTVLMNATTSGKSITSPSEISFYDLVFNGSGGGWNLGSDINVDNDMTITAGTLTGTGDITLPVGSLTGNGILSLGGGTTTIESTNTLGGTTAWTFYNLQLGDTFVVGTTTPLFTATTTVSGKFTIESAHYFNAAGTKWDLAGTGNVFIENGTFIEATSTVRYSGAGSDVLSTQYYNLDINSGSGAQTYIATGIGMIVDNDLTVGGTAASVFDLNSNDPALDVNGNVTILANGTFGASDTGVTTLAGSYDNNGTFNGNAGILTFDGTGAFSVAAGNSDFSTVIIDSAGDATVSEHATATVAWTLQSANTFTLSSGQLLAVGGTFYNSVGGAATTWTDSVLSLYGGNNYSINASTTVDTYATLDVDGTTQIRMWNSDAATTTVAATASLYSQDHSNTDGDLYVWGDYLNTSGNDYWSYATDFDGYDLSGGSERKVEVYFDSGASAAVTGGSLDVTGASSASTTIQNQGTGSYGLLVGGNASTSFSYYEIRDIDISGLVLTGNPTIETLSNGDLEVSQNTGSAITIGGTVITNNPAKNFTLNRFALNGVASGVNVTATGTSVSSWRFANHYGDIDGEGFDSDPDGDPGYVAWDDSAALITVSGNVYSDEGSTALASCDGATNNITLRVAGITSYSTTCDNSTGAYSISNVSYGSSDSLVVYIDNETEKGAAASKEPVSNINNLDIYENRVIARHESVNPLTIANMAVWDSSDDADIPFTAINAGTDTLTLPANRKLVVWDTKEFEPDGNVTLSGGGAGAAYDGTLEMYDNSTWTGQGSESISIGGSMLLGASADYITSNGTTTFTTTGAARTIDVNEDSFNNVVFNGSGSWTMSDPTATFNGDVTISAGVVTLVTGTTTFGGSFVNSGGSFNSSDGTALFTGASTKGVTLGGSDLATVQFNGGDYAFGDVNATTTDSLTINTGDVTLPSGTLAVDGDFRNVGGSVTHNTAELILTNVTSASVLASSSDLYGVTFDGGGNYDFEDNSLTLLDSLFIGNGAVTLASGTMSIGGSFDGSGGTFVHSTGTILFNSGDTGEYIDSDTSDFYNVQISSPAGGYTLISDATTTNNFVLASANTFIAQSGVTLEVNGVFQNLVGGTNTTWSGSSLYLAGTNAYEVNTKLSGGDQYDTLIVGPDSDLSLWNSAATTTNVDVTSSVYSQDNAFVNGDLYIYGDYHISTTTEYWSYATDFDGTDISGGTERAVTVSHATSATTTVDGGTLAVVGASGNETTITNQGSGEYSFNVSAGSLTAQYYVLRNMDIYGFNLTGTPVITSLSYGDYELAVDSGSLITLASSTLNANASLVIAGNRFATTTAIAGNNINLTGSTTNAWTYTSHTGNLDGEDFDIDGLDDCGSIRWNDSSCLLTQQTDYRWRNDDGGLGVPDSEWYDVSWNARKQIRVDNVDAATYTDAVVELLVTYDADMQADFDDLRFTDDTGTVIIPHWIGSSTNSAEAEVWVEVPSLPSEAMATIYMYYNNPSATTTSSSTLTFIASDDFEDNNISEYSGQTGLFNVGTAHNFDNTYGLDNNGNETGRANVGGIYRFDQTVSQGETIRYMQYMDTVSGTSDEVCTMFGVQSPGSANNNYAVCLEQLGTDRLVLVEDVVDNDASGTELASSTISTGTFNNGWYEVEIDWGTDDTIFVSLYEDGNTLVATTSVTDTTYTSGGFGFTYWFNYGGWDSFSSRPTLTTEPVILFGNEQADGGATWLAAQNTAGTYNVDDIARLRINIENTGLAIANQQFLLEYAALGASPSCESVDTSDYVSVPVQASCGTSPVCMQSSTYVTNGASTADLLRDAAGQFVSGEAREDPSNITGNIDIDQNEYTELEYVLTPTSNVVDQNLCFKVTDSGADYDTYLQVAQLNLRFDPVISTIVLNEGLDISLIPGATTTVYATGTVSDLNGFADLSLATSTIYRSGVAGGAACIADNNDCYISTTANSCSFTNCAGNSCTVECTADVYFHADPTDTGSAYDGQEWLAFIEVEDTAAGYDFASAIGVELNTLRAIDVNGAIDYGALAVNDDTGAFNASTSVDNQGNVEVNIEISGTDLSDGVTSVIPAAQQIFATTTFTYSSCGATCGILSSTTPVSLDVDLAKPSVDTPPVEDDVFWGIAIPFGVNSTAHAGINVFTPISP